MEQAPTKTAKRLIIAIKMPDPLLERMMAIPAIHLIREAYPDADLHFISSEHRIELLYSLPFEGFWHPWHDEEIKSVLDVHRFVTFLTLGDVDIFISLGQSLNEVCLGRLLGAKKRIGFAEGWKSWFLTLPVKKPSGFHLSEDYQYLFKEFTNRRIPETFKVKSREMLPYFQDEKSYLAIDLWPFPPGKMDDFWIEFFNQFTEKKFVLFFSEDEGKAALLVERFVQKLSDKNTYEIFTKSNLIEMGKMLAQAKGVVSRNSFINSYSTYLGTDALCIYESGEPRLDAPIPFFANWQIMDLRDMTSIQQSTAVESVAVRAKPQVDPFALYQQVIQMFYF